jgi:hypothetical protein
MKKICTFLGFCAINIFVVQAQTQDVGKLYNQAQQG